MRFLLGAIRKIAAWAAARRGGKRGIINRVGEVEQETRVSSEGSPRHAARKRNIARAR